MNAVDTNILIYAWDPRDPCKHEVAGRLLEQLTDGVLLWQVCVEFLAASRKLVRFGFNLTAAFDELRDMQKIWSTILPTAEVLDRTEELLNRFSLSFWDAMLIAAALQAGVQRLYSEDFSFGADIDGLEIINPFATA